MKFPIDQIWIDDNAWDYPLTRAILKMARNVQVLDGRAAAEAERDLSLEPDPFRRGKRHLKLVKHQGAFIKSCPGTREYICCGLQILHIGQGCPMDCRYCALQVYFNRPFLEIFVNVEDLFSELHEFLEAHSDKPHRFCTGEFTDSLALDPLTGLASRLVEEFSGLSNAYLELKTKTNLVGPLLEVDPRGHAVLSLSINAETVARNNELRAAPLSARFEAAARAVTRGYRVGFHFDPIIPFKGWQDEYAATIDTLFDTVDADAVAWISLGVLRFVPMLKQTATQRFGPLAYLHDGFITGLDGKSRLDVDRRISIYRFMCEEIRARSPEARVYLCMESPYVWERGLDIRMKSNEALALYLDQAFMNNGG